MLGSVNTNEVQWIQLSTICALQMVQCTSRKRLFVFSPHKPYYDTILTVHDKSHTKKKGKSVIWHIKPISDTALWNKGLPKNKTDQWWKHIQFYSIKKIIIIQQRLHPFLITLMHLKAHQQQKLIFIFRAIVRKKLRKFLLKSNANLNLSDFHNLNLAASLAYDSNESIQ